MNTPSNSAADIAQFSLDGDTRRAIIDNPRQYAIDNGLIAADSDVDVKVVVCNRDTMHVALVHKDMLDADLNAEQLDMIQAGNGYSTVGSAGSAGTISTANGTVGSFSTGGTVGSGGSVQP